MSQLDHDIRALLRQPSLCFVATTMADGSPQLTETWVDTDGEHVLINTVQGYVKVDNMRRDPRVAVAVADAADPTRYVQLRGRVLDITTDGAVDHIEDLSHRYLGTPYPWYGGRDQERVIVTIAVDSVSGQR